MWIGGREHGDMGCMPKWYWRNLATSVLVRFGVEIMQVHYTFMQDGVEIIQSKVLETEFEWRRDFSGF